MRARLLITTVLALLPPNIITALAPALAEVKEPMGLNHPMRQALRDIDQVKFEAEQMPIYSRYCFPQKTPMKKPTRDALYALDARLKALNETLNAQQTAFQNAGDTRLEAGIQAGFPPIDGMFPLHPNGALNNAYWGAALKYARAAQRAIDDKKLRLRNAPEVDCNTTETPKSERDAIGGGSQTPPLQPPIEPPKERVWDPLAGLTKPTFTAADSIIVPAFFCSDGEKAAMLARIAPAQAKAQGEADAYEAYARSIETRKAHLIAEGLPEHWQRSMDYERAQALRMRDDRLGIIPYLENVRKMILNTPVRDCTTKPKDGDKIGWDLKVGGEYGLGELKFPDASYLGVEDTGTTERINGVIKAAGESGSARRSGVEINVPLNWTPWQIFPDFGAKPTETRLGASITRTSANASRWGQFDPMGDTLFIPGLSDDIADTFSLPSTFNATIRDNVVDDFRYAGEFRRSEFGLKISEDFVFPSCDDFTLTKTFGLNQSWLDRRESFSAAVLDYFPIASPGFNVRADYHSVLDSSTTALKLGFDGAYAPKEWGGLYLSAGLSGWVGYTDTDGTAALRLDVNGGITEQGAEFSKSDTTFGYQLKGAIGVDFGFGRAELGVDYRNDGDTPVIDYDAGAAPRIRHEDREELIGVIRTTFSF
jgi:hypothetical protein